MEIEPGIRLEKPNLPEPVAETPISEPVLVARNKRFELYRHFDDNRVVYVTFCKTTQTCSVAVEKCAPGSFW